MPVFCLFSFADDAVESEDFSHLPCEQSARAALDKEKIDAALASVPDWVDVRPYIQLEQPLSDVFNMPKMAASVAIRTNDYLVPDFVKLPKTPVLLKQYIQQMNHWNKDVDAFRRGVFTSRTLSDLKFRGVTLESVAQAEKVNDRSHYSRLLRAAYREGDASADRSESMDVHSIVNLIRATETVRREYLDSADSQAGAAASSGQQADARNDDG
jgi:hypothetical protein